MHLLKSLFFTFAVTSLLAGCAVGSATAGYALKAETADKLSSEGEQLIVDRTKREILAERAEQCSQTGACQVN